MPRAARGARRGLVRDSASGGGAAAARGGLPLHLLCGALGSDKHRLPRGERRLASTVDLSDARTASLLSETGRFYGNAGVLGRNPYYILLRIQSNPPPGPDALPFLIRVPRRRPRTNP